jgi:hypothetical protein
MSRFVEIKYSSCNVRSGRQHVNSQAGVRHQSQGANQLCEVFELYREIVPTSKFKMEQLILLMIALAEGHDLRTSHCNTWHGALVIDPKGVWRPICEACRFASETVAESHQHEPPARGGIRSRGAAVAGYPLSNHSGRQRNSAHVIAQDSRAMLTGHPFERQNITGASCLCDFLNGFSLPV